MAYPDVHIVNSTNFYGQGKVEYLSGLCSDDDYKVNPSQDWTASSRGVCLVDKISAHMTVNGATYDATPYTSATGTSYSQFVIIQVTPTPPALYAFKVSRITDEAEAGGAPAE